MTDPSADRPAPGDPIRDYVRANARTYTEDAIREALLDAGHDRYQIELALAELHAPPLGSAMSASRVRWVALAITAAAYAIVYVLLLGRLDAAAWDSRLNFHDAAVTVLSVLLGGALVLSLLWISFWRSGRPVVAMGALLGLPLVLLGLIGGACVVSVR
jgi:hypothetical protein